YHSLSCALAQVNVVGTLDSALELATLGVDEVIPIESVAVLHARRLADRYPGLTARDLLHLSLCQLRKIKELKTFDRNLLAAFTGRQRRA
ncbi:MAG: PIN domain-containing protein, partial [Deltaproteobacteria bacterium]